MNKIHYKRLNCRLCESTDLELTLNLKPTPIGDRYLAIKEPEINSLLVPLDLYLCDSCGHLQTGSIIDPKQIYLHYLSRPAAINKNLSESYSQYCHQILRLYNPTPKRLILEIGSNDGTFLKFFKERGFNVVGVDPATNLSESASIIGIPTIPKFFNEQLAHEIKNSHGKASVMIANFVYGNIDNIIDTTRGIRNLLSDDGIFIFETNYRLDVFEKHLIESINNEHLSYFSVAPLKTFFNSQGLQLINVARVSSKGGSIRCTVQLDGGPRKVNKNVEDLIALEHASGLYNKRFYNSCSSNIDSVKNKLHQILELDLKKDLSLAGYGTSIGATTLIYQLDLGDIISFLVDDDPYRQNLFSPGYNIPVLSPTAIKVNKPEYVAILAPLYAKNIINKNIRFLTEGGKFIKVWPSVDVIKDNVG